MSKGTLYALGAYGLWGILPIYWRFLQDVSSSEILAHRVIWSLGILLILLAYMRRWDWLKRVVHDRKILLTFIVSAILLTANWYIFIWAINSEFIVEASLGYFINPLVNVLFGAVFLGERLRSWQKMAISLALVGVLWLTISLQALPWISLSLAITFGLYGLLRKTAALDALEGLSLEMMVLILPAVIYLIYLTSSSTLAFGKPPVSHTILLVLTGVVTTVPLLLFAMGARRVTLTTLGILQYTAPTLQFLIGVFLYGEPFSQNQLIGFSFIWVALIIYTGEGISFGRRETAVPASSMK